MRFGSPVRWQANCRKENNKKEEALKMFTILKEERLEKVEPEFIDDED